MRNKRLIDRSFISSGVLCIVLLLLVFQGTSEEGKTRLRILTYNIHHGEGMDNVFDYDRLAKIIRDLDPDIVALQEVDKETQRSQGVDQAKLMGELTQMNFIFGRAMYYQGGEYGEALLSRFPMEAVKIYTLPFRLGQEPRVALAARIHPAGELPGFIFVGTHLCHMSTETRLEQATRLHSIFSKEDSSPVILAGDLNAEKGSLPMDVFLQGGWVDASSPHSRIDYILTRSCDPWEVVEVLIVEDRNASDHFPLLVVLEWNPHSERIIPSGLLPF